MVVLAELLGWGISMREQVLLSWSGGKDSAMAFSELKKGHEYDVAALLVVITSDYDRVSMHGVRRVLLEKQAASLGVPVEKILIKRDDSSQDYENRIRLTLIRLRNKGISSVVFGDIFLEDIRKYREENMEKIEMRAIFPLWKREPAELARSFINRGFKAIITCVDTNALDRVFAGRLYDERFLSEIPSSVDPCGENGEFHTFVYDGPVFRNRIFFEKGESVLREDRFFFCDLIPTN